MSTILARCALGLLAAAAVPAAAHARMPTAGPVPSPVSVAAFPSEGIDPIITGSSAPASAAPAHPAAPAGPAANGEETPDETANDRDAPPPAAGTGAEHDPAEAEPNSEAAHHPAAPTVVGRAPMPFDVVRTLGFLQDQISRGNGRAIRVQALLLSRFAPSLVDADPAVWRDERNRRAAILFALSGGPPAVLERLLAAGAFDAETRPFAEGALAYLRNDRENAEAKLGVLDLDAAEPVLAAHLNLVLGQLRQDTKPAAAAANLDRARLLAPGGLIEEAALRLEVSLVETLDQPERADRLARQYLERFSRSSYAGNFLSRFAIVVADRRGRDPRTSLDALLDIAQGLAPGPKRELLLAVSRRALVGGDLGLSRLAGEAALGIAGTAGEDRQRATLYVAAAGLGSAESNGVGALGAVDRTMLHPADVRLLDAASKVQSGMDAPPVDGTAGPSPADGDSPVLERALKLLDAGTDAAGTAR